MERKRPPALTSPWKIGFLVSLLLVAMSIGVGYIITRTFGVSWTWLAFNGLSWEGIVFDQTAFLREMLPLAGAVAAAALLSYFLIAGAVRKYRRYVDSGLDYKNLIRSVQSIEDLRDEAKIKKLSNHPELRDFLLGVKSRIEEREAALEARQEAAEAQADQGYDRKELSSQSDVLVTAILNGEGAFREDLALSAPELKKIEVAIRDNLIAGGGGDAALCAARSVLSAEARALDEPYEEIRTEMEAVQSGARVIEELLSSARLALVEAPASSDAAGDAEAVMRAVERLDDVAKSLLALGEESKAIAINTATQASSAESLDVVEVAESVRDVAAKMNAIAGQWDDAAGAARGAFASMAERHSAAAPESEAGQPLAEASSKISLWNERAQLLSDRLRALRERSDAAFCTLADRLGAEDFSLAQPETPSESETPSPVPALDGDAGDDGFEVAGSSPVLEEQAESEAAPAGIVKEKQLFDGAADAADAADAEEDLFADIPHQTPSRHASKTGVESPAPQAPTVDMDSPAVKTPTVEMDIPAEEDPEESAAQREMEPSANETPAPDPEPTKPDAIDGLEEASAPKNPSSSPVSMLDGLESTSQAPKPAAAPDPTPEIELPGPSPTAGDTADSALGTQDGDGDADAVDLYTLGATDYEPEGTPATR